MPAASHVKTNRQHWDEDLSGCFGERARDYWAADEPFWGLWKVPQADLPVLPADVAGLDAVELGCGTGYVSAWLARRGARPIGLDNSAAQLATARAMQAEFDLSFPLIHGDAERTPLRAGCTDLVINEYGAAIWCDPYRWIPEAARLLRPGGRLIFMGGSTQLMLCLPDAGPAMDHLVRDLFGLHRLTWPDGPGVEFYLPHGERIRLLRSCGFVVEDLIEVQAPEAATGDYTDIVPAQWARRWPAEEVWFARLT
ncbi:MAG TPA: class I SAM-dependent methyltransferase [Pilimelia sp.]|nr:class I SAM-dependent methyltransferase [Pilimelia sp.]